MATLSKEVELHGDGEYRRIDTGYVARVKGRFAYLLEPDGSRCVDYVVGEWQCTIPTPEEADDEPS